MKILNEAETMTMEDLEIIKSRMEAANEIMNSVESGEDLPEDVSDMDEVVLLDDEKNPIMVGDPPHPMQICVWRLVQKCNIYIDNIKSDPTTSGLSPYLEKPIIWSFTAGTAWSNGFRIAFSPFFAHRITLKSQKAAKALLLKLTAEGNKDASAVNRRAGKEFEFVILHEIYHTLYMHHYRGFKKYGANPSDEEHYIANIAMDLEINRDICSLLPLYDGAVLAIDGIWYLDPKFMNLDGPEPRPFNTETWEPIYDYFMTHKDQLENLSENAKKASGDKTSNPTPKLNKNLEEKKSRPITQGFRDGWAAAVDMMKHGNLDWNTFPLPE